MAECKVLFKTIQNEQFHVYVDPKCSIQKLKHIFSLAYGYDIGSLKLCLKGTILKDEGTVDSLLTSADVLIVVGKCTSSV